MSETVLATLGVSSAIVNTIGLVPYIRDILKNKTKPERATWWVWLVLNVIAFGAQLAAGATWSLGLTAGILLSVGTIAVLSIKYGYGTFHSRDLIAIIIAILGAGISLLVNSPLLAILVVVIVDAVGYALTLIKTWAAPYTETLISWVLAVISALLGVLALGSLDFTQALYPAYVLLGNILLVTVIMYRRPIVSVEP